MLQARDIHMHADAVWSDRCRGRGFRKAASARRHHCAEMNGEPHRPCSQLRIRKPFRIVAMAQRRPVTNPKSFSLRFKTTNGDLGECRL
jgi:hypothetical protein